MLTPFISDPDFTLYVGDVRDVLRELPDESVHCIVTSPPYWNLRDYGVERQIGLEETPQAFVEEMVAVFRELRRVLHRAGTCWLNIGDSYASKQGGDPYSGFNSRWHGTERAGKQDQTGGAFPAQKSRRTPGLKSKDIVGVPWRLAFALQADGWILRSDIIWAKPNPMPESVTDRPTKAHEYVFLLTKSERYFFDQEAVREPVTGNAHARGNGLNPKARANADRSAGIKQNASMSAAINGLVTSRNIRTVWEITTQPYGEAHFATFPPELARRCIAAGTPTEVCTVCGKPRLRIIEKGEPELQADTWSARGAAHFDAERGEYVEAETTSTLKHVVPRETVGWTDCGHGSFEPGVVLDPFMGSGTTAFVARQLGRRSLGVELNPEYAEMIARRTQQLSILADDEAAA